MTAKEIQIPWVISSEKEVLIFERFCSLGNPTEGNNANFCRAIYLKHKVTPVFSSKTLSK